jgi:signal peptidase
MTPAYPVGTVVIAKKVDADTLKVGDVISFYSQDPTIAGMPNTHRIVSISKDEAGKTYFITKGDNNPTADKYPVYEAKVIGKVQGSIGSVGKIISKLKNRYVMFFLLIVPIVLIVVFELKNITKLLRRGDEEKPETDTEPKSKE